GRFNAFGTLIAVLLLATGTTGLGLARQPGWVQNLFTGVVLIAALAVTGLQSQQRRSEVEHIDDDTSTDDADADADAQPPAHRPQSGQSGIGEGPPTQTVNTYRTTQSKEHTT
ncbi:MAG TPA: hypothetical protein VMM60_11660, partial [Ilumatobacter sp.]|nr:hypothetical protein [Ilumatobacter sp.]